MLRNRMGKLVGLVLVSFLGMSLVGCTEVENIDVEDTNPIVEVQEEEISERMAIVKAEAERVTEGIEEYEVTTDRDTLILTYHQTKEVVEYAIETNKWDEIVDSAVSISNNIMDAMEVEENGDYFNGITVRHMIGDIDKNEYYLTIVGRDVVYNLASEYTTDKTTETIETAVEEKEVILVENNPNKEYKTVNRQQLDDCIDGDAIEIAGKVWGIEKNGTMGIKFQLETDNGNDGYFIEVNAPKEGLEGLEKDDTVRIQGTYRGVQAWSMNEDEENYGAHQINAMNIYLVK